jgi:nucleotide-binding universal stress UspA family protein
VIIMTAQILVPLDGSRLSEAVLPVLVKLFEGRKAQVTLFTVGDAPPATQRGRPSLSRPLPVGAVPLQHLMAAVMQPSPLTYAESRDQAVDRREHELVEYLDKAAKKLVEAGCKVDAAVHFGHPADEIIAMARRRKVDFIAMTTHGRTGLKRAVQGSVAAAVVSSGVAPVLLVRPKERKEPAAKKAAKR